MNTTGADPELLEHYSVLIYPFRHHAVGRQRNTRVTELESRRYALGIAAQRERTGRHARGDRTFFLPYIRGLLYPDIIRLQESTPSEDHGCGARLLSAWATPGWIAMSPSCLPRAWSVDASGRADAAVARSPSSASDSDGTARTTRYTAHCSWIDAVLFPSGLGFLLLHMRLNEEQPRLSGPYQLNGAMHTFIRRLTQLPCPVLRALIGGQEITVRDLMNYLTQGLAGPWTLPRKSRRSSAGPVASVSSIPTPTARPATLRRALPPAVVWLR